MILRGACSSVLSVLLIAAPWPAWSATASTVRIRLNSGSSSTGQVLPLSGSGLKLTPGLLPSGLKLTPTLVPQNGVTAVTGNDAALISAQGDAVAAVQNPAATLTQASLGSAGTNGAAKTGGVQSAQAPVFADDASVSGKTMVLVGTKSSRPFIIREVMRVAKQLNLNIVLVDDPELRSNSAEFIPDSHFIAAPVNRRDKDTVNSIAEAVAAHPEAAKADVVASFMSLHANLTGRITDKLGVAGIPGTAVSAADDKPEARTLLNAVKGLEVPFAEVESAEEARDAYREISDNGKYKVVVKSSRGENSRFLALGIDNADDAAEAFLNLDKGLKEFMARPEAKHTTFSSHPGIMIERMLEKAPGTEETSVEVVMQNGKPAFAIVSDTQGIGKKKELAGGIMVFPSQAPQKEHQSLIDASARALNALGITDGNARLDMITTEDGPRVVEVNPFMGGVAIWQAVKSLTGMSLVEQGMRSLLGLKVDPGHAADGVVHYIFLASGATGVVAKVEGVEEARQSEGVVEVRSFVEPGDTITAAAGNAYEEWAEIIAKGRTWAEAIDSAVSAARKMILHVASPQRGDYLQPQAKDLAPQPEKVGLYSKVVMGFLSTFLLVSTVVESTSLAVSQMTQPISQGFLALAALTSISYMAYTVGSFLGGSWVKRFGIKNTYRAVLGARVAVWTTMALLFNPATGTVALALLIPLFSIDYFFHSIGRVAEHSLQVAWFKDSETASSRFGTWRDVVEYATIFIGSGMGLAVAAFGFGAVIYPAPLLFGAAALIALALKLPGVDPKAKKGDGNWKEGISVIIKNSGIYKPLVGFALVNSFLYMMYYITATAFGAFATSSPEQAAKVAGSLTGIFGIGALIGTVLMNKIAARIDAKVAKAAKDDKKRTESRLYALSAARVLPWAAAALLGSWAFASSAVLTTIVWPIFPISIALLGIGLTAQMASNHLDTIMKANIPSDKKDTTVGAIRGLIYLSHVVGFALWGGLFAAFGTGAFMLFAAFYTVVAAVYLWLARDLKKGA